jgi:hypothetical protein
LISSESYLLKHLFIGLTAFRLRKICWPVRADAFYIVMPKQAAEELADLREMKENPINRRPDLRSSPKAPRMIGKRSINL